MVFEAGVGFALCTRRRNFAHAAPVESKNDNNASPAEGRGERLNAPSAVLPRRGAGSKVRRADRLREAPEPEGILTMSGFKVAVAGATGNVGREMLAILA